MAGYLGSVPVPQATQHRESFTCTEGQTSFATAGYTAQFVDVYLNGSHLSPADFTATNGSDVVLAVAASADDVCDIISYTPFEVANQTFTGTIDITGELKTTTLGTSNFRAGVNAGNSIASGGNYNVTVGDEAGTALTTGDGNTAVGYEALLDNTTGTSNVSVGYRSSYNNTTAGSNTVVGYQAYYTATTGVQNAIMGYNSGYSITDGNDNSFFGNDSGHKTTTGDSNTAVGSDALRQNTTASENTAVGYQAGYANTTNSYSTFIGKASGFNSTGAQSTYVGEQSGYYITSGAKNTILGRYNGNSGGLDIRTSSNNVVLSDGDGNIRALFDSSGNLRIGNVAAGSRKVQIESTGANYVLGLDNTNGSAPYGIYVDYSAAAPNGSNYEFFVGLDSSATRIQIFSSGNIVNANNSYGAISDVKLKENIIDASSQWDDIKALTVRKYSMKSDELDAPNRLGVIAQELEAAGMGGLVNESQDKDKDLKDLGTTTKSVNYSILYMKAVKALQEAMTRIEALETKVTALEGA